MLRRGASQVLRAARGAGARSAAPARSMGVIRQRLSDLSEDRGETEVLQYGGMKWTVKDAKRYGDALAAGLAEMAVGPGDAVASLLAPDAPEAHCAQLAAAVSGVVYCAVDPALGADGVRAALVESGAKVLLHGGAEETVALLAAAVPGFGAYEARAGVGFYSPAAPQLKYFVSTGLDMQPASANYQHLLALDGGRYAAGEPVADDALLGKAYAAGGAASWTHREAIEQDAYPALTAVLNLQPAVYP